MADFPNTVEQVLECLAEPFPPEKIHWRVGATNAKKLGVPVWEATKGIALAYIDARDVMDRLDAVVGSKDWKDSYKETSSGRVLCTLKIRFDHVPGGWEWVGKSDGAGSTGTEGEKGAISDAFKRAAVKWGIGRYLYGLNSPWCDLQNGHLPKNFDGSEYLKAFKPYIHIAHMDAVKANWDSIVTIKDHLLNNKLSAAWEAWNEIEEDERRNLRVAATKGGILTVEEGKKLKQASDEDFDPEAGVYKSIAARNAA